VSKLSISHNFTLSNNALLSIEDTVGLIVWSAAEIAVTMICIGVPVCRPLYKTFLGKLTSQGSSYHRSGKSNNPIALRTVGGSKRPTAPTPIDVSRQHDLNDPENHYIGQGLNCDQKSPSTFYVYAGRATHDEGSDEEILTDNYHGNIRDSKVEVPRNGIKVTDEYHITRQQTNNRF
jgi:hypothetical protein